MTTILFTGGGKDATLTYLLAKEQGYKIDKFVVFTYNGKVGAGMHRPECATETPHPSWTPVEAPVNETMDEWFERVLKMFKPDICIHGFTYAYPPFQRICRRLKCKMVTPLMGMSASQVVDELVKRKIKLKVITGENKGKIIAKKSDKIPSMISGIDHPVTKEHTAVISEINYGNS